MKTKVAAIYGKRDVRLRVFELPEITDNELLVSVISDSVCLSTWKAALGNDSNLLIVFYVQIMPDDFVMQLHRF